LHYAVAVILIQRTDTISLYTFIHSIYQRSKHVDAQRIAEPWSANNWRLRYLCIRIPFRQ